MKAVVFLTENPQDFRARCMTAMPPAALHICIHGSIIAVLGTVWGKFCCCFVWFVFSGVLLCPLESYCTTLCFFARQLTLVLVNSLLVATAKTEGKGSCSWARVSLYMSLLVKKHLMENVFQNVTLAFWQYRACIATCQSPIPWNTFSY